MLKLFYLINEPFDGYQTGYRKALHILKNEGIISDVKYFSFFPEERKNGGWENTLNIVHNQISEYQPEIILTAHLSKRHVIKQEFINRINKALNKKPVWAYDERDVYGLLRKPLHKNVLRFASYCDLVTLCTYGNLLNRFKKWGSQNIIYLPHVYDQNFGTNWVPTHEREFDIIMIANRARSRIPFASMPGINEREKIVKIFSRKFGKRFAVFGRGWEGFSRAQGAVNFYEQEKLNRRSWLTIGMDHFYNYEGYFSDRLPIALVSGVPHLTYKTPGLEEIFIDRKHLFFFKKPEEALEIALSLLKKDKDELIKFGQVARNYVFDKFSEVERYRKIINLSIDILNKKNY